jgi:hypothetical protein
MDRFSAKPMPRTKAKYVSMMSQSIVVRPIPQPPFFFFQVRVFSKRNLPVPGMKRKRLRPDDLTHTLATTYSPQNVAFQAFTYLAV